MTTVIAVASGKGGTGKTTLAVNMALCRSAETILLDCDVEAPNAHLFLKPVWKKKDPVTVPKPVFDHSRCNGCAQCREVCRFNAIAILAGKPVLFQELCHSCGGCIRKCPAAAITEGELQVGSCECGSAGELSFVHGFLNIGESRSSPVIVKVKKKAGEREFVLIDAPPGTSCPMVESVRGSDYTVLVTEPTLFGLNDLKLAVDTMRKLGIPFGVVINRADLGNGMVRKYCNMERISILGELPFDHRVAVLCSQGEAVYEALPEYRGLFSNILERVLCEIMQ